MKPAAVTASAPVRLAKPCGWQNRAVGKTVRLAKPCGQAYPRLGAPWHHPVWPFCSGAGVRNLGRTPGSVAAFRNFLPTCFETSLHYSVGAWQSDPAATAPPAVQRRHQRWPECRTGGRAASVQDIRHGGTIPSTAPAGPWPHRIVSGPEMPPDLPMIPGRGFTRFSAV